MKMAATKALADLAKEPVPDYIAHAYSGKRCNMGLSTLFQNHSTVEF